MARDLTTGWKRIGRSGPAVDGRVIKPEMIEQAAANYNKDLFTALIWPEHFRYINLGTVEELRAADNEEGGKDLFAKISPNQFYLQANSAGQKLFTSMELTPDFRKTGQWYLTGLGATDDPASAATTEMRLSASAKPGVFLAKAVEHADHTFNDQSEPSFLKKIAAALFTNPTFEDEDMAENAEFKKLKADMDALQQKFAALKPSESEKPGEQKSAGNEDELFNKLADKLSTTIAEKFGLKEQPKPNPEDEQLNKLFTKLSTMLEEKFGKKPDGEGDKGDKGDKDKGGDDVQALQAQFKALSDKLDAALKEQPGTNGGEHFGAGDKAENYL
jgi:molybdopterin converting factor small subunit